MNHLLAASSLSPNYFIGSLVFVVFAIVEWWMLFVKAGRPGWAAIIPIYNIYTLIKISGHSGWWLLWMLIPIVNIIAGIIIWVDVAKKFGKGVGFGLGLIFFNFIFAGILAFGSSTYNETA